MKKVLFVGPDTTDSDRYTGGIHHIIQPLRNHTSSFKENGIDISFFNTERISRSMDSGGRFRLENIINACMVFRDCSKEMTKNNYDTILYASSTGFALLKDLIIADQLKRKHNVKLIFQIHCADIDVILPKDYRLDKVIFSYLVRVCDKCVFLSSALRDILIEKGYPRESAYVLYNYHNIQDYGKVIGERLNRRIGEKMRFLFMGSFDRRKGIVDLLDALGTMDEELYYLDICGSYNSNDKELKLLIDQFCLTHALSVTNHGYVEGEKKNDLLLKADVCILPSYSEGLPVILLEAMAASCAIIATDVGAITEIITDGKNGIIIDPGDIGALRNAILSMINNKNQLRTMQENNCEMAKKFTIGAYIKELCNILC